MCNFSRGMLATGLTIIYEDNGNDSWLAIKVLIAVRARPKSHFIIHSRENFRCFIMMMINLLMEEGRLVGTVLPFSC